jgi:hypothetical protein
MYLRICGSFKSEKIVRSANLKIIWSANPQVVTFAEVPQIKQNYFCDLQNLRTATSSLSALFHSISSWIFWQ